MALNFRASSTRNTLYDDVNCDVQVHKPSRTVVPTRSVVISSNGPLLADRSQGTVTLIQISPLDDDDVQPGSATWCVLPCCLLADLGCCAVWLPNGAAGVCGGRMALQGVRRPNGAAGVCGGRMALRGVRLPNGAAVCDATVGAPTRCGRVRRPSGAAGRAATEWRCGHHVGAGFCTVVW